MGFDFSNCQCSCAPQLGWADVDLVRWGAILDSYCLLPGYCIIAHLYILGKQKQQKPKYCRFGAVSTFNIKVDLGYYYNLQYISTRRSFSEVQHSYESFLLIIFVHILHSQIFPQCMLVAVLFLTRLFTQVSTQCQISNAVTMQPGFQ